jgi:hypothetical protein
VFAGSVDSANDLFALDPPTAEPFRQASNERPLAQPTSIVEQLGAANAQIVLESLDGSIGFVFRRGSSRAATVSIDENRGDCARLAVRRLAALPFGARQTLE